VQLVDVDLELPDHMGGQRQDQRRDVAAEQAIEAPTDAVIVERWQLTVAEPVRYRVVSRRPLAHAVEWLAREQHVLEQEADTGRRSDPAASIRAGQEGAENLSRHILLRIPLMIGKAPIRQELSVRLLARAISPGRGAVVERGTWCFLGFSICAAPEERVIGEG